MVEGAAVIGTVINKNLEYYVYSDEEREINWGQLAVDIFTVGLEVFTIKNSANGLKNAEAASWCFVAGTLVATEDGQKPIEEIQAGDKVLSENPETGEVAYKTVEETYVNETTELVHVFVNGEEIVTTPSHPFYVPKFGWTLAINLRAGDVLVLSNGEYVVVEAIQHEILENPIKVYNFEVEDFHTYFVGESSVLVLNMCAELDDNSGRVFTSNDPLVGDVATAIDNAVPGKVIDVNQIAYRADGTILTDYDIVLDNMIIQVKSGGAKGLTKQLIASSQSSGKIAIGYAPDIKPSVFKEATRNGYNVFTDLESLLEYIKGI